MEKRQEGATTDISKEDEGSSKPAADKWSSLYQAQHSNAELLLGTAAPFMMPSGVDFWFSCSQEGGMQRTFSSLICKLPAMQVAASREPHYVGSRSIVGLVRLQGHLPFQDGIPKGYPKRRQQVIQGWHVCSAYGAPQCDVLTLSDSHNIRHGSTAVSIRSLILCLSSSGQDLACGFVQKLAHGSCRSQ